MSFWKNAEQMPHEEVPPSEEEMLEEDLARLQDRISALETYIGTDAWTPDDRVLLARLEAEKKEKSERLGDLHQMKKAA